MKFYKFKRAFCLTTAVFLLLCGCEKKPSAKNETVSAPVNIKWGIVRYNPYIKTVNPSSEVMDYIKQKFNCNIEFEYYDSFNTKILNHMTDNGTNPDILTMEALSVEGQFLARNNLVCTADSIIGDQSHNITKKVWNFLSETDGTLYGIPGRYATEKQFLNDSFGLNEGVYIAQPYYDLMGRPEIRNINDIIKVAQDFIADYDRLRSTADIPYPERESDFDAIPIVLGNSGSGVETLKHLFGIYPVFEQNGTIMHSISSPKWGNLASFLNNISKLSLKSMSLSGTSLKTALNGRSLFYIGSAACINNINFESKDFSYELISIDVSQNAYSVNPYGSCQTYVFKNSDVQKTANTLIKFLVSDDGCRLVKYGIENKHWIPTGDSFLQLEWVTKRFAEERGEFLNDTGIGQLLFLTSLEKDNPNTPDVLSTEKNAFFTMVLNFISGSNEAIKLEKLATFEIDLCQRAASLDGAQHPQKYSVIQSDIIHFPLYERQYKINSLEERFEYWKGQNIKGFVS